MDKSMGSDRVQVVFRQESALLWQEPDPDVLMLHSFSLFQRMPVPARDEKPRHGKYELLD
jgi:hypothetical protein